MRPTRINRIFGVLISVFLLCASVPAQYQLGPRRMAFRQTPTLVNRTRLRPSLGLRPRLGLVGSVGGIASDGVAAPEKGLVVNTIAPNYSAARTDGQRLSVMINGQTIGTPIYDWQLIPIAKFADSPFYSCFTLFGRDSFGGRTAGYHPDFTNTLMGLRLFQLDSLILTKDSIDLVKDGERYILGAGESAPNIVENSKGLAVFEKFQEKTEDLSTYNSYIISDYRREITFRADGNRLSITGEPYYYFWKLDPDSEDKFLGGEAEETVRTSLGSASQRSKAWLINQMVSEARKYDQLTEGNGFLDDYLNRELKDFVRTPVAKRVALLRLKSPASLFELLIQLKAFNSLDWTLEMPELSEKVSNETAMLRAINPAVWDTGVNLIRYAAFFRYCKVKNPVQWQQFMRQINSAPAPKPPVITPSGFEYDY